MHHRARHLRDQGGAGVGIPCYRFRWLLRCEMPFYVEVVNATVDEESLIVPRSLGGGYAFFSIFSHVLFVVFIVRAWRLRDYFGAVMVSFLTLISILYHTCQTTDVCMGIPLLRWQTNDHGSASIAPYVILWVIMASPGPTHTTRTRLLAYALSYIPLSCVILYWTLLYHPLDIVPTLVIVVMGGLGFTIYYALFRVEPYVHASSPKFPTHAYNLKVVWFGGGVVTGIVGGLFFIIPDNSSLLHSWWHVFISASLICFQESVFGVPKNQPSPSSAPLPLPPKPRPPTFMMMDNGEIEVTLYPELELARAEVITADSNETALLITSDMHGAPPSALFL